MVKLQTFEICLTVQEAYFKSEPPQKDAEREVCDWFTTDKPILDF